jgi:hypothetical protein
VVILYLDLLLAPPETSLLSMEKTQLRAQKGSGSGLKREPMEILIYQATSRDKSRKPMDLSRSTLATTRAVERAVILMATWFSLFFVRTAILIASAASPEVATSEATTFLLAEHSMETTTVEREDLKYGTDIVSRFHFHIVSRREV